MTLKTKLSLGLGFLFLIILTLAAFCSYYVGTLGQESENILKDNYYSIVYSRNMLSALDDMRSSISSTLLTSHTGKMSDYDQKLFESGRKTFEINLKRENNNITEIQEKEYVETLNHDYEMYTKLCVHLISGTSRSLLYVNDFLPACEKLKTSINGIYDVNMQAVLRKNQLTKQDSSRFINSMAIIGSFCILLALGYFWYFPVYISSTLSYLSDRMKKLLRCVGVKFDVQTNDEAYIILHAINLLEIKLGMKGEDRRDEPSGT